MLNKIIQAAVPFIIGFILFKVLYAHNKEDIDNLMNWLKSLFKPKQQMSKEEHLLVLQKTLTQLKRDKETQAKIDDIKKEIEALK